MGNNKVGIVCCSNGQKITYAEKIKQLENTLLDMGIEPVFSDFIYEKENVFCGTAQERAAALMDFYKDDEMVEIFDISGGDAANGVLPYLDYDVIANSKKRFWGYSDLTTIVNAIYTKAGRPSVLYQIRNLIYDHKEQQIADFRNTLLEGGNDLFQITYDFIQGTQMQGIVVGGNIRCFLKLAGTEYMPDLQDKILLLESYGGDVAKMETYLCQLQQLGAFDKVVGILLGTFSEMEEKGYEPDIKTLVKRIAGKDLPIAVTRDIGHGTDAKAIVIGEEMRFARKKIAFICVHNSCRSQIAEALGRKYLSDSFECYSAGTETKPQINQDAVRLMKELYGIDMEQTQYSKLLAEIPDPDIAISMGCNVGCPFIGRGFDDNWGLDDPTGKSDEEFIKVIKEIEKRILELR